MADRTKKLEGNATGRFYVDETCIDCDLCRENAPRHFRRDDDERVSYVHCQPTDPDQIAACLDAMEECPVEAIGQDG